MHEEVFDLNFPAHNGIIAARLFHGEMTMIGFLYPSTGICPTTQIATRVTIRISMVDNTNADLSVIFFTYDRLHNLQETASTTITSRVPLKPAKPITISSSVSLDYVTYYGTTIHGSTATVLCYFYDKYSYKVGGQLCREGFNSNKGNVQLVALDGIQNTSALPLAVIET